MFKLRSQVKLTSANKGASGKAMTNNVQNLKVNNCHVNKSLVKINRTRQLTQTVESFQGIHGINPSSSMA